MIFAMVVLTPGADWSRRMWRHSAVTSPFIQSRSRRFLSSDLWGRRRRGRVLRHRAVLLLTFLTSLPTRDDCTHWARCDACLVLSDHKTRFEQFEMEEECWVLLGLTCLLQVLLLRVQLLRFSHETNSLSFLQSRFTCQRKISSWVKLRKKKPRTLIGALKPDKNIK